MIDDYPQSKKPLWPHIGRETLALLASMLLFPFGTRNTKKKTRRSAEQRTVVLIHGYLSNRSAMLLLSLYLRARGLKQVLSFTYASAEGIEAGAKSLKDFLARQVRGGRVDLVCHSMGGLVARVYLQELGGARRVDRCITLGTPHQGTYGAYWVPSRVGHELRPDSAVLKKIEASKANAINVKFSSIVAGSDNVVVPRVFAANEETAVLPDVGHLGLLYSPNAFRMIVKFLQAV